MEFRRGVAAYGVTCGLAGVPLRGLEIPDIDAHVDSVMLETDEAVDDLRIVFSSGWVADVQAKRTLRRGAAFDAAVKQWVRAGRAGVDPKQHRLVIASGELNGPMRALRDHLNRRRVGASSAASAVEANISKHLDDLLSGLGQQQRENVLNAAVIWEIPVEEVDHHGSREALALLGNAGISIAPGQTANAWKQLLSTAGQLARRRGGYSLAAWYAEIRSAGFVTNAVRETPAGVLERRRAALERYAGRLIREAESLDLRIMGAQLPIIGLREADAQVAVKARADDRVRHTDPLWAFLRRHRSVLTGLPGSGKSTIMRHTAGRLAQDLLRELRAEQNGEPAYPFPVRASLKLINALGDTRSFRDRLIEVVVRDDASSDRELIRTEIETLLDEDQPIVLLLDSLDETYEDRTLVVAELDHLLRSLPESSCVIATRDVALGQAATLGWPEVRTTTPQKIDTLVYAVLNAAAQHESLVSPERERWVEQRQTWVEGVLARDTTLSETPLIPTLLTVLAVERPHGRIPTRRADILLAIVEDVMRRYEVPRSTSHLLKTSELRITDVTMMQVFAEVARIVLDHEGVADIDDVRTGVQVMLQADWGLPFGPARVAAVDVIRFLDEAGIFVASESEGVVTARLAIFADIGDAIHAIGHTGDKPSWVDRRLRAGHLEPVMMAATLDGQVHEALERYVADGVQDLEIARAMARAHVEGAVFSETTLDHLRLCLIRSIRDGTRAGWGDWSPLAGLGVPEHLISMCLEAAAQHGAKHELLARASLALASSETGALGLGAKGLLEIMRMHTLPQSERESQNDTVWEVISVDPILSSVQREVAKFLLERDVPGSVEAISQCARYAPAVLSEYLLDALREHGHLEAVQEVLNEQNSGPKFTKAAFWPDAPDRSDYVRLLDLISQGRHGGLGAAQQVQLNELADFLETLNMNDTGLGSLLSESEDFLDGLVNLIRTLFAFDRNLLASEAQIALDRLEGDSSLDPYFSLFDGARARTTTDWDVIADPEDSVYRLVELFTRTEAQAWLAAKCLWRSSRAAPWAEPLLRDLIPSLASSPRHQRVAASTLASLSTGPEPGCWSDDSNPVLRWVVAMSTPAERDGMLTSKMRKFLEDGDGYVREAAVRKLGGLDIPELEEILAQITQEVSPGWMCLSCRTVNPPGSSYCQEDGCHIVGPDVPRLAAELLAELRGA